MCVNRINFFLIFLVFAFLGCEAQKKISVTCVDAETKERLENVHVLIEAGKNGDYTKSGAEGDTDEQGNFETDIMIGCSFGCYDIYVTYSKEGYQTKKDFNILEGKIELVRENI